MHTDKSLVKKFEPCEESSKEIFKFLEKKRKTIPCNSHGVKLILSGIVLNLSCSSKTAENA